MKRCRECAEDFPATKDFFYPAKSTIDGLKGTCKECEKLSSKARYESNKENRAKKALERYHSLSLEEKRNVKPRDPIRRRVAQRAYYKKNNLKILETKRIWRDNNRKAFNEIKRRREQNRRARKRELDATFNQNQWERCKEFFDYRCCYCGESKPLEQDHFIPVAAGGEYTHNNIVPSCRNCNSKKNTFNFFEWYPGYEMYCERREKQILKYLNYNNKKQQMSIL